MTVNQSTVFDPVRWIRTIVSRSHNGITTPVTYDSATGTYTYGSDIFKIREHIETFDDDRYFLLAGTHCGFFCSVLGYNTFASLLTDKTMLNFATRRPSENWLHPVTHESAQWQ